MSGQELSDFFAEQEEEEDGQPETPESCFGKNGGKPRLMSEQCPTCIFRPGNPMDLKPGRVKDMVNAANRQGSQGIICHQTLSYGGHPDHGGALCRGYYDSSGPQNNFVRIMERLGGFEEVPPPESTESS
jgi:hypothetical protein